MGVIREKRQIGSLGPVGVVRQQSSNQYQRIAAATNKLTELAIGEMGRQSAISGEQLAQQEETSRITTLDPITNKPQALSWLQDNNFLGQTGKQAYEETIAKRFQFEIDNQLKIKAKEFAIKYQDQDGGVELFKDQMHQYIDNMATGSEATGYSNYIMQSGVGLTTTTSIYLMDKAATRERIKTTNSIVLGLDEQLDAIEALTSSGETEKAQLLINDILSTAKNAEGSNHFTASQRKAFEDNSATRFAIGTLRSRMANLTSTQAETVLRAISSGSAANLNEEQHSEELNILSDALRYFRTTSEDGTEITDFDSIRALAPIVEQQKLEILRNEKENQVTNNILDQENYDSMAFNARNLGGRVLESNEIKGPENKKKLILDRYDAAEAELDIRESYESRRLGTAITTAQKQELRTEISKGLIIAAYDDLQASGLSPAEIVDSLKGSFIRRGAVTGLTGKAHTAMSTFIELTKRGAMSSADIDEFINDLSDTDFRTTEKYKQEQRTLVSDTIKTYTENVSTQYDEGVEFITKSEFISETQRQTALTNLQRAKSDNIIGNAITDQTTSIGLQAAMNYAVNGIEDNLPPELKAVVDEALKFTNKEAIAGQLNVRQTIIEGVEADNRAIQKSVNIRTDLVSGKFIERNKENADEIQDFILETAGMGEEFFFSQEAFNPNNTGALLLSKSIQAGIMPPALKQMFNDLAEGRVKGTEADLNILTLYEQFSQQPRGQNAVVNLFSGLGMDQTSTRLEVISNVRKITGESIGDISLRLKQAFQDPNIMQTMETNFANHFKNKTKSKSIDANDFVRFAVPDAMTNPQAISMLGSFARYMGALGTDTDTIQNNLQNYYNGMFSDTEGYVIDVASERGERSRYSFNHLFADKKMKDFFIKKVNNELMNLMIDTSTPNDSRIALRLSTDDSIENRAFLMPMGVSQGGGVRFMAVYRNNGNLVPVLDKTGYPIGFSTSESDVAAFAKSINKESYMKTLSMDQLNDIRRNKITADEIIDSTQSGPEQGYIVPEDAQSSPYAGAGMN
tara:strand:+ start:3810 stop:6899 length:3090 start_codon:yes stop_codon:yes gene_type:complete